MSTLINGRLLVILYDRLFPSALLYICRSFLKINIKKPINLTEAEVDELAPIADEILAGLEVKMNPMVAFFSVSSIMYFGKIMDQAGEPTAPSVQKPVTPNAAPLVRIDKPKKKAGRPKKS